MKKVTYESIGKACGVSKVAAYKALTGKPGVSDALRARIIATAEQMQYVSVAARKADKNFLFVVNKNYFATSNEQYYTNIYYCLKQEISARNSTLQLYLLAPYYKPSAFTAELNAMRETLSGIFVAGELEQRYMNGIRELGVPCIVLDFYSPVYPNNYIHINNFHLGFTAAEYLIGKGHTRIGFVGDVYSTHAVCERYLGYCKALITHKIAANSEWHINMNLEHGAEIDNILPAVLPTAFITHCDSAAQKLYIALRLAGLSVPGDVSIVSFDNTALCKVLNPTLTSVGVDTARFAAKGLESMDKLIKGYAKRINIELPPPAICERNSVRTIT